jgi:riboflavin kinase/FMN adenylyltransferase
MKVIHRLEEIEKIQNQYPALGLTIGNFDGVHLGHQQLLKHLKQKCDDRSLKFAVITFVPHPQKILHAERERYLISSYQQRRKYLEQNGVDYLIEIDFTRDFSTLSGEDFLDQYILTYPNIESIYLGYDFAFGAHKQGSFDLVKNHCKLKHIDVEIQPKFEFDGKVISSSRIREAIESGAVDLAGELLGRSLCLDGVVVKGEGRGKKIGFPTANIQVPRDSIVPKLGVYITRTLYKGMVFKSITNIGKNPTFKDSEQVTIETNIFEFDSDIYGESLHIEFISRVRDEKRFPTVTDLVDQIKKDVEIARNYKV